MMIFFYKECKNKLTDSEDIFLRNIKFLSYSGNGRKKNARNSYIIKYADVFDYYSGDLQRDPVDDETGYHVLFSRLLHLSSSANC